MMLDILLNDLPSHTIADRAGEISVLPQLASPQSFLQSRELAEQLPRADALYNPNHLSDGPSGRKRYQNMYMVLCYFHFRYIKSMKIVQMLRENGAKVSYADPYVPVCRGHRHYPDIDMKSVKITPQSLRKADVVLLLTDHTEFPYSFTEKHAKVIIDTRDAFERNGISSKKVFKA